MPAARAPAALAAAGAFALLCCVSATDNSTDVAVAVEDERGSVPLAFAFTIGAGLCTTVGGALSFLGDVEDKRILAVCLALSAGVMLYVSFVEIFVKSKDAMTEHFIEQGNDEDRADDLANLSTTGLFFAGVLLTYLLEKAMKAWATRKEESMAVAAAEADVAMIGAEMIGAEKAKMICPPICPCHGPESAVTLDDISAVLLATAEAKEGGQLSGADISSLVEQIKSGSSGPGADAAAAKQLRAMGVFTAAAIFAHNFPEGLATFVGTLADPAAGASLAFAIGLHNIPEGICVGAPLYRAAVAEGPRDADGKPTAASIRSARWKAFGASFLSGVSEPVGGVIGWILLVVMSGGEDISAVSYGIMFGLVAGMMIYICVSQLIPGAHKYDPEDKLATPFLVMGMAVMAASLLLFLI